MTIRAGDMAAGSQDARAVTQSLHHDLLAGDGEGP